MLDNILLIVHIISFTSWMAALFYLPRIFVYHTMSKTKDSYDLFCTMEIKLYKIILLPAMKLTIISGIFLLINTELYTNIFFYIKIFLIFILLIISIFYKKILNNFKQNKNKYSQIFFRIINEVPVVIFILIVIFIITKPY